MQVYDFPPDPPRFRYSPNWTAIITWSIVIALTVGPLVACGRTFFAR